MAVYSLYILNKAGGLIFQILQKKLKKLSSNDYLVLAGTFHGIHAISAKISPIPGSCGIKSLESASFHLHCFQTVTGVKFLLITEPKQSNFDYLLKQIYEIYADYVMKNPFYQIEMPIRCELFDKHLASLLNNIV